MLPGREKPAAFYMLEVEAAQNFRTERRPVEFVVTAGFEDVAGFRAGLAAGAMLHGEQQWLEEGPVVFLVKELVQAREKPGDKLRLFFARLRFGDVDGAGIIEAAFIAALALL
jgi:hypothetical protein